MISAREAGPAESAETMPRAAGLLNFRRPAGLAIVYLMARRGRASAKVLAHSEISSVRRGSAHFQK